MEIQFASFGNPRRKKKLKKAKRSVAKRRKAFKLKTRKKKLKKVKRSAVVAKKRRKKSRRKMHAKKRVKKVHAAKKRRHRRKRKNPESAYGRHPGVAFDPTGLSGAQRKAYGRPVSGKWPTDKEIKALQAKIDKLKKSPTPIGKMGFVRLKGLQTKLVKALASRNKGLTKVAALKAKGFDVSIKESAAKRKKKKSKKGRKSMAKKRKKKKKLKSKARRRRKSRKSRKSRRRVKMVKHAHKKGRKNYKRKTKVSGMLKGGRKGKRVKVKVSALLNPRRKKRKSRRKARMVRHAASDRHYRKGQRAHLSRIKAKFNPLGGPMDGQIRSLTGMGTEEIASLALGGALYSTVNQMVNKYLPASISHMLSSLPVIGPVIVPIAAGMACKFLSEKVPQRQAAKALDMIGEGLVGAAVVGAGVSLGQSVLPMIPGFAPASPALSGINYTPNMNGVFYTPGLSGINYTPNMNGPQMGIMPRLNGMGASADFGAADYGGGAGYTEEHKFSRADFGKDADYGDEDPLDEDNMAGMG